MKGVMVKGFKVGDKVRYTTKDHPAETGTISKLHNSCRAGVAEIRPADGSRKIARRLQHVSKVV